MNDYGYLKVLSQLSSNVYRDKDSLDIPFGYTVAKKGIAEFLSGFQAIIYEKDGKKILAIRGKKLNLKNLI